MSLIKKIVDFFTKAKSTITAFKTKARNFVIDHKEDIKNLMTVLQFLYERGNGAAKMQKVVDTVCEAIGASEYKEDIVEYVKKECQKVYDELLNDGGLEKK